jgi:hypothetical protein
LGDLAISGGGGGGKKGKKGKKNKKKGGGGGGGGGADSAIKGKGEALAEVWSKEFAAEGEVTCCHDKLLATTQT